MRKAELRIIRTAIPPSPVVIVFGAEGEALTEAVLAQRSFTASLRLQAPELHAQRPTIHIPLFAATVVLGYVHHEAAHVNGTSHHVVPP